ncbi:MAG: YhcB family protein [Alkalimonas sp.]|nr:YhcB family protein [Alkalimonas sp.]
MTITMTLVWLAVGFIGGGLLGWWLALRQHNQHQLQQELAETKEQLKKYRADVSNHLETTNQLITQLQDNYGKIANHLQQSKMELVEKPMLEKSPDEKLSYLSSDTASHIRESLHQLDEKKPTYSQSYEQPRDYAGQSSGLFKEDQKKSAQKEVSSAHKD